MNSPCERIIPGQIGSDLYNEHISRYLFTTQFINDKYVLDLGCGTGYGSKIMSDAARKVIGVDISWDAINHARKHFQSKKMSFHIEDGSMLGLADKSFDVVVSFEVIEHVKDYTEMIKEAKRVLIDDGIFILSTPNRRYAEEKGETNPYHSHEFDYDEFLRLLKEFFGQVQILSENHCHGISISSPHCKKGYVHFPPHIQASAKDNFFKTPSYFIAVCCMNQKNMPAMKRLFYVPSEANILREKEHHIKALQEQLKEFDERAEWAVKTDAELKEKSKWAYELNIELQEKKEYLAQLQQKLDEQSDWALKLDAELKEKDQYINRLQRDFDEKSNWASKLDEELKEKNEYIVKLQREFEEKAVWASQLNKDLKAKDKQLWRLQYELDEKANITAKLVAELENQKASLHTLNQILQEKDQAIIAMQEDLKKKANSFAKLQQELSAIKNTRVFRLGKKMGFIKH